MGINSIARPYVQYPVGGRHLRRPRLPLSADRPPAGYGLGHPEKPLGGTPEIDDLLFRNAVEAGAEEHFPGFLRPVRADDQERNFWKISRYAETHELVAITTQKEQFYLWKNQLAMPHCGVPVMFHTVDDEAEYREMLRKHYVLGVYTDITERIS